MSTYEIKFRTKNHSDCTCYIPNQPSPESALDYVRTFYGNKMGPNSVLRIFSVIHEDNCK